MLLELQEVMPTQPATRTVCENPPRIGEILGDYQTLSGLTRDVISAWPEFQEAEGAKDFLWPGQKGRLFTKPTTSVSFSREKTDWTVRNVQVDTSRSVGHRLDVKTYTPNDSGGITNEGYSLTGLRRLTGDGKQTAKIDYQKFSVAQSGDVLQSEHEWEDPVSKSGAPAGKIVRLLNL